MLTFAGIIFLGIFAFGLLFVTGVGPMFVLGLPQLIARVRKSYGRMSVPYVEKNSRQPLALSILIPVFQAPSELEKTLRSIEEARRFPERAGLDSIEICIGIDGDCSECEEVAESHTVNIFRTHENQGKWRTLKRLVECSGPSQWIAFVDAGVEWSEDLLVNCAQSFHQQDIMGIAPTYRIKNAGRMSRLFWWIESFIKRAENFVGGPISVHGATVLYRRSELVTALHELGGVSWINDDVVIPLVMRTMFPEKKIIYQGTMGVHDIVQQEGSDSGRRRLRLALGNCQWIKWLYPRIWQRNRSIAILALRRIARVVWAWWLLFLSLGISLSVLQGGSEPNHYLIPLLSVLSLPGVVLLRRLLPGVPFIRTISSAVEGSLKSPLYLITLKQKRRILWN
jgi:glycosyltransferase involved in cell wall biosynthesis